MPTFETSIFLVIFEACVLSSLVRRLCLHLSEEIGSGMNTSLCDELTICVISHCCTSIKRKITATYALVNRFLFHVQTCLQNHVVMQR